MYLSPRLTRGRKRTGLINQIFMQPVFMRSRAEHGNKAVLTHFPFSLEVPPQPQREKAIVNHVKVSFFCYEVLFQQPS